MNTARRLEYIEEYYFSRKLKEVGHLISHGKPIINLGLNLWFEIFLRISKFLEKVIFSVSLWFFLIFSEENFLIFQSDIAAAEIKISNGISFIIFW